MNPPWGGTTHTSSTGMTGMTNLCTFPNPRHTAFRQSQREIESPFRKAAWEIRRGRVGEGERQREMLRPEFLHTKAPALSPQGFPQFAPAHISETQQICHWGGVGGGNPQTKPPTQATYPQFPAFHFHVSLFDDVVEISSHGSAAEQPGSAATEPKALVLLLPPPPPPPPPLGSSTAVVLPPLPSSAPPSFTCFQTFASTPVLSPPLSLSIVLVGRSAGRFLLFGWKIKMTDRLETVTSFSGSGFSLHPFLSPALPPP